MRSEVRVVLVTLLTGVVSCVVSVAIADMTSTMADQTAPVLRAFVHQK